MATTSPFEWRASNEIDSFDTGEGCLFACSSKQTSTNPTLTLFPPLVKSTSSLIIDSSISPAPGDDLSPPNSVEADRINGIAVPVSASAGWSQSPPKKEGVYPSCVTYDLRLKTNSNQNGMAKGAIHDSLELSVVLEYANPHYQSGESMVVKVAIAKTLVNEELGTALALVVTQFQEYHPEKNHWVDITADVDYTQTADAVVDAVLQDPNAGQTAGKATVTARTVELTLGPFSAKAQIHLTFQADRLYTYDAMSLRADAADIGSQRLLPLWLTLPFAPVDHQAGLSSVAVRLQAPPGTAVLPIDLYQEAYWHLKKQEDMKAATILAVSELLQNGESVGCQFQWESLPPRSTGLFAWLVLPNPNPAEESMFDFVHIGRCLEELDSSAYSVTQAQVTVQVPPASDVASLQVPLPGHGPIGSLYRLKVKMPEAQPRQLPYFILNITLSDKSGSTGIGVGTMNGTKLVTMRERFNQLAEVRFLKRLESIPALVQAKVLRSEDVWMEVFLPFDHDAPAEFISRITFRVSDVLDSVVQVVQAIRNGNNFGASRLPAVLKYVQAIRGATPGGATDFSVGPKTLVNFFGHWQEEAQGLASADIIPCTFVEFDTDGGHNGSSGYINALKNLCQCCDVRDGVVTGFGSWLNQGCATKVARVIGFVPALLALQVPEFGTEGLDKVFRTSFSAWVSALRKPPKLTLKLSAGRVSFPAPVASRNANAIEVLGFRRIGERNEQLPNFGVPDVSDETYTKTVIAHIPAGDELLFYVVSRLVHPAELVRVMEAEVTADGSSSAAITRGRVWEAEETSVGSFLAFDWLVLLTSQSGKKGFQLSPLMATSLSSRLEDEISFRFNIASPSGTTSYLGRCKILASRASIDTAHQPEPPACPITVLPPKLKTASPGGPSLLHPGLTQAVFTHNGVSTPIWYQGSGGFPPGCPITVLPPKLKTASPGGPSLLHPGLTQVVFTYNGVTTPIWYQGSGSLLFGSNSSASPPQGFLFGSNSSASLSHAPSFGSPSFGSGPPQSFGGFGCNSSASFKLSHAPASACFGANSSASLSHAPVNRSDPSWRYALGIPVGSDAPLERQEYNDLFNAISQIVHACQRLQHDPSINFCCDACGRQLLRGEPRYHCYDCQDFDACFNCKDRHNTPFHRIAIINPSCMPAAPLEDPLVSGLLQAPSGSVPLGGLTQEAGAPKRDQTVVWCKAQLCRFLLSILHWWPVFRATCEFRQKLPTSLPREMAEKVARSVNDDKNLNELLETVKIIVDSLMREDTKIRPTARSTTGAASVFTTTYC